MPRNGSGTYSLPAGSLVTDGQTALASQHNTPLNDLAADLNLARPIVAGGTGGTTKAEAISNLTLATTPRRVTYGGTADAITLTTGASLSALVTGMTFSFIATADNTGPATINTDGLGDVDAKTIAGDDLPEAYIRTGWPTTVMYDGTQWLVIPAPQHVVLTETFTFVHPDLSFSALHTGYLPFFLSTGSVDASQRDRKMARAGRVIGARLDLKGTRSAGTATLKPVISGVAQDFDDGSVILDGTNTTGAASLVSYGNGVPFVAGDTLGSQIVTNALWATSGQSDLISQFTVIYEPI